MKFKISLLLAALLLLFYLTHPVLAGQGCGTNWLGSDANDQDFYVSKNQNLGSTGSMATPTVSVSSQSKATSPTKLGQSVRDDSGSIISGLTPDKTSPQTPGAAITWTASADQSNLLYKFLLKGPSTDGKLVEKTNWTANNVWVWNTTEADIGSGQVEVRVRDGKHAGPDSFDDRKDTSFTINAETTENTDEQKDVTTSSLDSFNPHPPSRTATKTIKPRIAPDERPRLPLGNPNGPNMSMPDPSPKPLKSAVSVDQTSTDQTDNANSVDTNLADTNSNSVNTVAASEPSESEPSDVGGKWLVQFDNSGESMELILIQTGGTIMGSGNLNGETKIPLIASGSLNGDKLKLDVKTVIGKYVNQIDKRYTMDLKLTDSALSGSYEAYSGETSVGKGRVAATRPGA